MTLYSYSAIQAPCQTRALSRIFNWGPQTQPSLTHPKVHKRYKITEQSNAKHLDSASSIQAVSVNLLVLLDSTKNK